MNQNLFKELASLRRSSMPDRSSRGRQQGRLSTGYPMTYGKMRKAGRTL